MRGCNDMGHGTCGGVLYVRRCSCDIVFVALVARVLSIKNLLNPRALLLFCSPKLRGRGRWGEVPAIRHKTTFPGSIDSFDHLVRTLPGTRGHGPHVVQGLDVWV